MDFGAHLPLIDFRYGRFSHDRLVAVTRAARRFGYSWLGAGDRVLFPAPWLDGPTALAAVIEHSGDMTLATTVTPPVVRGPVALAKTLAALDVLSEGRLVVGLGAGCARDVAATGTDPTERWQRFDEAVAALRSLLAIHEQPHRGRFYDVDGVALEPRPARRPWPPLWLDSDGSPSGLRRVARFAEGWMVSAARTTPQRFAEASAGLGQALRNHNRPAHGFPNALVSVFLYLTHHTTEAEWILSEVLAPTLRCPAQRLRGRVLVGSVDHAVELLTRYTRAGLQRALLWPIVDEAEQLRLFAEQVAPAVRVAWPIRVRG